MPYYETLQIMYMVAAFIGIALAVILGFVCKSIGIRKGYSAEVSFCAGFFLGLVGLIIMAVLSDKNQTAMAQTAAISVPDEIEKYKSLLDDGVITKEEFQAKKKDLLGL